MRPRSVYTQKSRLRLTAVILFSCLLVFHLVFPLVLPQFLFQITAPPIRVWKGATDWLARTIGTLESKEKLFEENKFLAQELASAQERLLILSVLQEDNRKLQELEGRSKKEKSTLAAVLLSPPLSPYDILVLDVGAREGISSGDLVRSTNGSPLGRITEVFRDFSRAELFSTPGMETAIRIGEKGIQGKAKGIGGGEFQIILPREFEIAQGDPVVFPELSASPFGIVGSVVYQETDFLQLVSFRSPVNVRELSYVLVDSSDTLVQDDDSR